MEPDVKLTKLASCAGCGAKVGAGTLVKMLDGFRTHTDPRLTRPSFRRRTFSHRSSMTRFCTARSPQRTR